MPYQEIGRRIQRAREQAGLSQGELAARIGCTQSALSNYELGKRRIYLSTLEEIAQVLRKPLRYFVELHSEGSAQSQALLLEDQQLREILLQASELPAEDKQRVLEYIRWRKSILLSTLGETIEVWEGSKFSPRG